MMAGIRHVTQSPGLGRALLMSMPTHAAKIGMKRELIGPSQRWYLK